jgi:hypothetical protein
MVKRAEGGVRERVKRGVWEKGWKEVQGLTVEQWKLVSDKVQAH